MGTPFGGRRGLKLDEAAASYFPRANGGGQRRVRKARAGSKAGLSWADQARGAVDAAFTSVYLRGALLPRRIL
jgi:hypothetical protein